MKIIKWEPWSDPLKPLLKKREDEEEEATEARKTFFEDDEDEDEDDVKEWNGPAIIGPLGIVPLNEGNLPSKLYNFWVGHANFGISKQLRNIISQVEGVEALNVFSRYRFRVAIGKAFDTETVKTAILHACNPPPPVAKKFESSLSIDKMKRALSQTYKFWAISTDENNKYQVAGGSTIEEVQNKIKSHSGETVVSWEGNE